MTRFGPAGNSISFTEMGYKHSIQVPAYLAAMGLGAFEYQCGRGVRISRDKARELGEEAKKYDIELSVHAPYYISLASDEEQKRDNSIGYVLQSAEAVDAMGGNRIVVHPGGLGGLDRPQALELACKTLSRCVTALDERGLGHVHICPELMGKVGQLGTLDEVLSMCSLDERLIPCIDFGHLNARTGGSLREYGDFEAVFDAVRDALGEERMKKIHIHFSKIEYTLKGGEKRHLTFEDEQYGPDYTPVVSILAKRDCNGVVICESDGTQAEDAAVMKLEFERHKKGE